MRHMLGRMRLDLWRLQLVRKWLRIVWLSGVLWRVRIVLHQLLLSDVLLDLVALVWRQTDHQPTGPLDRTDFPYPFDVV